MVTKKVDEERVIDDLLEDLDRARMLLLKCGQIDICTEISNRMRQLVRRLEELNEKVSDTSEDAEE